MIGDTETATTMNCAYGENCNIRAAKMKQDGSKALGWREQDGRVTDEFARSPQLTHEQDGEGEDGREKHDEFDM